MVKVTAFFRRIFVTEKTEIPFAIQLLERSLRLLFESYDVSKVKAYVERQFSKILQNRNSLQDFIFAKEFRGRQGYKPGACVPALEIAKLVNYVVTLFVNL